MPQYPPLSDLEDRRRQGYPFKSELSYLLTGDPRPVHEQLSAMPYKPPPFDLNNPLTRALGGQDLLRLQQQMQNTPYSPVPHPWR